MSHPWPISEKAEAVRQPEPTWLDGMLYAIRDKI
jgi:hypothetical protein